MKVYGSILLFITLFILPSVYGECYIRTHGEINEDIINDIENFCGYKLGVYEEIFGENFNITIEVFDRKDKLELYVGRKLPGYAYSIYEFNKVNVKASNLSSSKYFISPYILLFREIPKEVGYQVFFQSLKGRSVPLWFEYAIPYYVSGDWDMTMFRKISNKERGLLSFEELSSARKIGRKKNLAIAQFYTIGKFFFDKGYYENLKELMNNLQKYGFSKAFELTYNQSLEDFEKEYMKYMENLSKFEEEVYLRATIPVVSNDVDLYYAWDSLSKFCISNNMIFTQANLSNPILKKADFVIILGGPRAKDIGDFVSGMLTKKEKEEIEEEGRIIFKRDVWKRGQLVLIIAGKDRFYTKKLVEEYLGRRS